MRKGLYLILCLLFSVTSVAAADGAAYLGLTPEELYGQWGEPEYIRVVEYGPIQKYAYFSPLEWERIADLAPLAQGDDVYLKSGPIPLQYHFTYVPIFTPGSRFSPQYRVGEYTIYPEGRLTIADVVAYVPEGKDLGDQENQAYFHSFGGSYPPAVIIQEKREELSGWRRFRERGELALLWEIGLRDQLTPQELTGDTVVSYITVRVAPLERHYAGAVSIANPF
ncbi:MAG: hypothetical protein ACOYD6_04210 [Limnochordia bacterium]